MEEKIRKKKILILTLGVGDLLYKNGERKVEDLGERERRIREGFDKAEFGYRLADYSFGKGDVIKSEFVAEPLCKKYQPDLVFVLGTVKSGWSGFYRKFCGAGKEIGEEAYDKHIKNTIRLDEIEQSYGIGTAEEELEKLQAEMKEIFSGVTLSEDKEERVLPVLTGYGVNDKQLKDNYNTLSGMIKSLDPDTEYEVAFDITHSFRSLPLYNYVILHYFKHISKHKLEISHIYYGNVDITRETPGNVAPIVDLKNLVNVLELTEGVSEFKNTGSTVTLSKNLEKNGLKSLNEALKKFDMAAQLNDFGKIAEALDELKKELKKPNKGKGSYADLGAMIHEVLEQDFPSERCKKELIGLASDSKKKAEILKQCKAYAYFQYLLTKWHMKQKRYGVTVATVLEALRSYLTIYYLKNDLTIKKLQDRKIRETAEEVMKKVKFSFDVNNNIFSLKDIVETIEEVKKIRNTFAHNLNRDEENTNEFSTLKNPSQSIKEFVGYMDEFVRLIEEDDGELKAELGKIYSGMNSEQKEEGEATNKYAEGVKKELNDAVQEESEKKEKRKFGVRLLISHKNKNNYEDSLYRSNEIQYQVYGFNSAIQGELREQLLDNYKKEKRYLNDLYVLAEKLSNAVRTFQEKEGKNGIDIVFDQGMTGIEEYVYAYVLKKENGIERIYKYFENETRLMKHTGIIIPYKKGSARFKDESVVKIEHK